MGDLVSSPSTEQKQCKHTKKREKLEQFFFFFFKNVNLCTVRNCTCEIKTYKNVPSDSASSPPPQSWHLPKDV